MSQKRSTFKSCIPLFIKPGSSNTAIAGIHLYMPMPSGLCFSDLGIYIRQIPCAYVITITYIFVPVETHEQHDDSMLHCDNLMDDVNPIEDEDTSIEDEDHMPEDFVSAMHD